MQLDWLCVDLIVRLGSSMTPVKQIPHAVWAVGERSKLPVPETPQGVSSRLLRNASRRVMLDLRAGHTASCLTLIVEQLQ